MLRTGVLGREAELATATSFLDGVAERARALVIEGDAGIGKTAVYRATIDDATARGYVVLRCAGEETEARLSFIGLTDLIGDVLDEFAASLPPVQVEALDLALSRLRGDAERMPDPKAAGIALRSLLAHVATRAPVLIAVDDVGWLDDSTLSALAFVARRVEELPIGLLTTLRLPAEEADPIGLDRAFGPDRSCRMRLGPLPVDPVVRIIEGRFPGRFAQPVLRRVAAASGGNPLFALDIAGSLDPCARRRRANRFRFPKACTPSSPAESRRSAKRPGRRCSLLRRCSTRRPPSSSGRHPKRDLPRVRRRKWSASNGAVSCSLIRCTRLRCTVVRRRAGGGRCIVGSPNWSLIARNGRGTGR